MSKFRHTGQKERMMVSKKKYLRLRAALRTELSISWLES